MGELVAALKNIQDQLSILTPPEIMGKTDKDSFWLRSTLRGVKKITQLDTKYVAVDFKEFRKIVDWDWTDNKKYIAEKYDCDNFAFSFKARVDRKFHINSVGLVVDYESAHAYNVVLFKDGTYKVFEPQSDTWPKKGSKLYKFNPETVIVII